MEDRPRKQVLEGRLRRGLAAAPLALLAVLACAGCRTGAVGMTEDPEAGFQRRAAVLLEQVAERYVPTVYSDRGKFTFPVVIARMALHGETDARAEAYLQEYADGKYGFFHFPFVGMARIMGRHPQAPAVARHREQFLRQILFPPPGDHYNALTGEGTENHIGMSRTSGYIFACEALAYPALREQAGEWQALLSAWALAWAETVYRHGTGEWDSSVYTAYNLIGWLNLFDFAPDPRVRESARAVLDYYAANIALKLTQGLHGGPESRAGTRIGPLPRTATEFLGWLWFGADDAALPEGFFTSKEYIQSVHAATSGYRPPAQLLALARKQVPAPATYHLAKPDYLLTRAGESREVFHIGATFTLGTVQTPYGGWANADYGFINWRLVITDPAGHPGVISGNGGMRSTLHPRGRNPFDQFLQHATTVVQMTRVPAGAELMDAQIAALVRVWQEAHARDFKARWGKPHREHPGPVGGHGADGMATAAMSLLYFPEDAAVAEEGSRVHIAYSGTYVAVRTLSGRPPLITPGRLADEAPRDAVAGFVVEVANGAEFGPFGAFQRAVAERTRLRPDPDDALKFHYTDLAGRELSFRHATEGTWTEPIFDFGYGVTEQRVGVNTTDWRQPEWPGGPGHGRIPEAWVDGERLEPRPDAAIIDGPLVRLAGGILELTGVDGTRHISTPWTAAAPESR